MPNVPAVSMESTTWSGKVRYYAGTSPTERANKG